MRIFYLPFLIILFTLTACGGELPAHIAAQFATPSPTPFLPSSKSSNPISETSDDEIQINIEYQEISGSELYKEVPEAFAWGDFAGPTQFSDLEIPAPFPRLELSDDYETIVILGSDQRVNDPSYRTDVILLIIANKSDDSATIISFPRDLYVYQPGYKLDRINNAHLRGGAELIYLTFEYNFGIRPDHFVLVNFEGFNSIIDSLGGINVDVSSELTDHRDGFGDFSISAGSATMDAETALWYVRSRGTSSDFDRGRRQQEVLTGLFFSAFSFDMLSNASEIYQAYKDSVATDISLLEFLALAPLAGQIFSSHNIETYSITESDVDPWINAANAYVLIPDRVKLFTIFQNALD
jgi:LCP family protein required for cell wall assembly